MEHEHEKMQRKVGLLDAPLFLVSQHVICLVVSVMTLGNINGENVIGNSHYGREERDRKITYEKNS
jgi:hypothetical protein